MTRVDLFDYVDGLYDEADRPEREQALNDENLRAEEREAAAKRTNALLDELWSLMVNTDGDPVFRNVVLRWVESARDRVQRDA